MADSKFSFQEVGRIYDPAWMSPEALTKKPSEINQEASDMWSFSIILWELATREIPFVALSPMECGMKVSSLQIKFKQLLFSNSNSLQFLKKPF